MKKLLIWGYHIKDVEKRKKLKIPFSGDIGISEVFNPKKTHPSFVYPWVSVSIHKEILPMPDQLTICIKKIRG